MCGGRIFRRGDTGRNLVGGKSYVLRGGRVVDPANGFDGVRDIGVSDGVFADPASLKSPEEVDVSGLVVAPGFVDLHVHLRQPGRSDQETIASGTRAAAAGGFTTVVAMPNTSPVADNAGTLEYIRRHAETDGVVKVLICAAMTKDLDGEAMTSVGGLKRSGAVALSDDGKCVSNHEVMRHIMEYSKTFGLPILDHCEDVVLAGDGVAHEGYQSIMLGLRGIPSASEELMVARDIILAEMIDWRVHIQHISSKNSVRMVREARARGVKVTAEATPHHLFLTDDLLKSFDSNYKMKPPLMSDDHRSELVEALAEGVITCVATDHAPHTATSKLVEFDYAPFGVVGLETAVPMCLTELYHKDIMPLVNIVARFTTGPAEVLGLPLGTFDEGAPADITVLDLDSEWKVDSSKFLSKSRNTPFDGYGVKGRVAATIVDGEVVHGSPRK